MFNAKLLSALLLGLSITLTTVPLYAQTPPSGQPGQGRTEELAKKLQLTPEQKTKFMQLMGDTVKQIQGILTPEQKQKFEASLNGGAMMKEALSEVDLARDQKMKLKSIMQNYQQQMATILTPEQQSQLEQMRKK